MANARSLLIAGGGDAPSARDRMELPVSWRNHLPGGSRAHHQVYEYFQPFLRLPKVPPAKERQRPLYFIATTFMPSSPCKKLRTAPPGDDHGDAITTFGMVLRANNVGKGMIGHAADLRGGPCPCGKRARQASDDDAQRRRCT